jgi:hypothetical protein
MQWDVFFSFKKLLLINWRNKGLSLKPTNKVNEDKAMKNFLILFEKITL